MAYEIHLAAFDGPFDLLLHLIQKNEIDIYDIPIAEITAQYLEYLAQMEALDLEKDPKGNATRGEAAQLLYDVLRSTKLLWE